MLVKLIKYELKSVFKFLIIFYALGLFFAGLTRFIFEFESTVIISILGAVSSGVTISMIFNIVINSLMRGWVRFKQNLYGDESYLTHTLPVKKTTLYLSKILTALISLVVSTLVIILMLVIVYYSKDNVEFFKTILDNILLTFGFNYSILISIVILLFLEFMNLLVSGFVGIILGHRMNNAKTGFSILYSFIIYMVTQILIFGVIYSLTFINADFNLLFQVSEFTNPTIQELFKVLINIALILYTISILVWSFIGARLLKKGVNVD